MSGVSMLRSYKLFNEKNMYGLCGADCLWLPNSIFFKDSELTVDSATKTNPSVDWPLKCLWMGHSRFVDGS